MVDHIKSFSKLESKNDILFLDDYWSRYRRILFDSRDDKSILTLRDQINNIKNARRKVFIN